MPQKYSDIHIVLSIGAPVGVRLKHITTHVHYYIHDAFNFSISKYRSYGPLFADMYKHSISPLKPY